MMNKLIKDPEYLNIQFAYSEVAKLVDASAPTGRAPHLSMGKVGRTGQVVDCPFCGGKMKMNLLLSTNQFRCAKCDEDGNSVTLFAKIAGIDNKKAYAELKNRYKGLPSDLKAKFSVPTNFAEEDMLDLAPIGIRDFAYRELLKSSTLSEKHRANLRKRGLTDEEIDSTMFKTLPCIGIKTIAEKCIVDSGISQIITDKKWGIPGFYWDEKDGCYMFLRRKAPMLVPVVNREGKISMFELRSNDLPKNASERAKEKFTRYKRFSSSEEKYGVSTSGGDSIHHAGFDFESETTPKVVTLTEGALKATVASILAGNKPFIALLGVQNQSQLPDECRWLKEHGTERINIAFDMDYKTNEVVKQALNDAIQTILAAGLTVNHQPWPPEYKGVDDYLAARRAYKETSR